MTYAPRSSGACSFLHQGEVASWPAKRARGVDAGAHT